MVEYNKIIIDMKDISNKRFGRLTVIKNIGKNKWGNAIWMCKCDCGNNHIVASNKLIQGKTKSCGCLRHDICTKQFEKHGITTNGKPRTFIIWNGMKARCMNPKSVSYKNYGKRGIGICQDWMSFENFHKWAIRNGYEADLTIDRIDNNKDYSPDNCRWLPRKENLLKQRRYTQITINGETKTLCTWSKIISVSRYILFKYYREKGIERTEIAIKECLLTGRGQVYFVNKFLKQKELV